ncbi:MAG: methionine adenosyltransferase [Candidatus Nealsonbacteria bacterium RIFCSPHIGHO2_01_FULL_43_31]|uniref:S-adenosylmethionine synthase n=1 Tax=Candidatus Nealsonbacteria bacterium RIFCSPHIGHO2_01_FULL_43_31 TaxID=1801665 RepID=A0A1G2E4H2_9BACT|nr:MAG: S-adenosylmethionine synthase [Parcubacteria group bacterium GW2011_GWB1_43_6]OGZ20589.1 MAG: methionine adenosyltransferase [Candidatus Nealsonbacteria bacterium RIFCSPHIGHO2_01_FULL_43_31]OGZ25075.1 MAG: methionine adenosyltransferase [Candidatus Nealsonbacteria bacterium RIFCSPLOWO2_01_FULL_43_36]
MALKKYLFTSESVTEGHPDKVCDQISDAVYDEMLKQDVDSHAGIECFATTGLVIVGGEARTKAYVNIQDTVRRVLREIGYDKQEYGFCADDIGVIVTLHEQSPDIAQGVDENIDKDKELGAGDQGLMFGYATNETEEFMPMTLVLAHKLTRKLAEVRKNKTLPYLRPDGKSQVTIEYEDGKAKRLEAVVVAAHHSAEVDIEQVRSDIKKYVIMPVVGNLVDENTKYFINSTGRFVLGGPPADTGLTGRKIIVDTYGGVGAHGGGCFSGKCVTKVDRSGAYMARYVAKNIVAAGLADKCELQVAYSIGIAQPVSIFVNTEGTGKIPDDQIAEIIKKVFDFRPKQIINHLDLKRPIYQKTAAYGHFGRNDPDFTWEKTDKVDEIKKYASELHQI